MKTITYTCDKCLKTFANDAELITIGSENGQELRCVNNLQERAVIEMNRHSDIHFCSKDCFVSYFFHYSLNEKQFVYGFASWLQQENFTNPDMNVSDWVNKYFNEKAKKLTDEETD